jgi:hypothetical protein
MTTQTDNIISSVDRLITKFGRAEDVTFTRKVYGTHNTSSLTATASTPLTFTIKAAPVDFTSYELVNTAVVGATKKLYISGSSAYVPFESDTVALGSVTYRILKVKSYEVNSVNCGYQLQIGV